MGLDVSYRLVAGIPYDKVIRREVRETEVTRYDEKTGKPYQTKVKETVFVLAGGREIKASYLSFEDQGWDEVGLDAFSSSCESPPEVVGCMVKETESHRRGPDLVAVSEQEIAAAKEKAARLLREHLGSDLPVQLFLIPNISY